MATLTASRPSTEPSFIRRAFGSVAKLGFVAAAATFADQALSRGKGMERINSALRNNGLKGLDDYSFSDGIINAVQNFSDLVKTGLEKTGLSPDNAGYVAGGGAALLGTLAVTGLPSSLNPFGNSKIHNHAVEFGQQVISDSRSGLFQKARATKGEVFQAISKELGDLDGKADLIANFYQNGFSKNGPYTGTGANITAADIAALNPEQRSEYNSIQDAIGKFERLGINPEDMSSLSDQEIAAMATSATNDAMHPARWKQGLALAFGAVAVDKVVLNGKFTDAVFEKVVPEGMRDTFGSWTEGLTDTFTSALGQGTNAVVNGLGNFIGADAAQTLVPFLALTGGVIGGGLLGKEHGGGIGAIAGMLTAGAIAWSAIENSNLPGQFRNNFFTKDYAQLIDNWQSGKYEASSKPPEPQMP
ncbi:MAG: hypothetical protein R3D88_02670 [Alphaproteobacteria bacterium]|nr:hypothetical protein [Alphaproteobacteria bacterium]